MSISSMQALDHATVEGEGGAFCQLSVSVDPDGLGYATVGGEGGVFWAELGAGGGPPAGGGFTRVYPGLVRVYPGIVRVFPL